MLTIRKKKEVAPVVQKKWMMSMRYYQSTYKKIVDKKPTAKDVLEFASEPYGGKIIRMPKHVEVTEVWEISKSLVK